MKFIFSFLFLFIITFVSAQKKELDHTVYNDWKSVPQSILSNNGEVGAYIIKPHRGDGKAFWYNTSNLKTDSLDRFSQLKFSAESNYLVGKIKPGFDTLRTLELDEVAKKDWVKDSLAIVLLSSDSIIKFPEVKSFKLNKSNNWMAFYSFKNKEEEQQKRRCKLFKKKDKSTPYTSTGKQLTLFNPITGDEKIFKDVANYEFGKNGMYLFYSLHKKEDKDSSYLRMYNLSTGKEITIDNGFSALGNYSFNYDGNQFAFLASKDTVEENKVFDLYHWNLETRELSVLVDTNVITLPGNTVSNNGDVYFSRDGKRLFFGVAETPTQEPEDTLLNSEKATLDLWHYQDKRLQPQQLLEKKRDENKTINSVIALGNTNKILVFENDTLDVYPLDHSNSPYALGISNQRYEGAYNWSYPWPNDYYRVNLSTGKTELIAEGIGYRTELSPSGKYFVYFDESDEKIKIKKIDEQETECISCLKDVNWQDDVNGMPHVAGPIGFVGFTKGEQSFILHSEFDVWEYDIANNKLTSVSGEEGMANKIKYRLNLWERDSTYISFDNAYLKGFNTITKDESVHQMRDHANHYDLTDVYTTNHQVYGIHKAKESDKVIFKQGNLIDYPNVQITTTDFIDPTQISDANPQQAEYNWATVEQVNWKSYAGDSLNGLLYKPENYDANKTYPLLIYYYELYSDDINNHYAPRPTASIIFATEYASAGYLVFYPDVRYTPGHPAQGAYDCIMSGTDMLLKAYPNIDSTRMGLQGQSWGGYQTAQLVTMTNRYAAGMAGAPVSNMFSAYGGIRWGSGLNRQFQYEKTQSRIGKTIWEAPELYVENSPIFGVPNIETPLLIMHNDGDGAVPWYQGIEMFVGMKRLGKPVWMLNYNGDKHNLYNNANRIDLSIRMRQFFDHYLLEKPAPRWLLEGIPATVKGKEYRLEIKD